MRVRNLAKEVMDVFEEADGLAAQLQANTGLACPQGCGRCCDSPAVEACPSEFLPLAIHLHDAGLSETLLAKIALQQTDLCPVYQPGDKGCCTAYRHRGLICRLMGYSSMRDKHGRRKLIACRVFKETQPEKILIAEEYFNRALPPYSAQLYDRLKYGYPSLLQESLPVKQAVKIAIEYVEAQFYYEESELGAQQV